MDNVEQPKEFSFTDWQKDEERKGVYFIEIVDPEGEEYAIIVHRASLAYPLDGREATAKVRKAYKICEALNAQSKKEGL